MNVKKVRAPLDEISPILLAMLEENVDVALTITGNSMYPMLTHRRDTVVLSACDKRGLKRGDLPLYKRDNGMYVLHRVVGVNQDSYDLCGDNQYVIEKGLPMNNIIAKVTSFERNGRKYDCNEPMYQLYWRIRVATIPLRRIWNVYLWGLARRIVGKLKRMIAGGS